MSKAPRIIKKYANRRLYDTETSQSITLQDVSDLIGSGESVQVLEAKTDKDITRSVLIHIVADREMLGQPVLSNEFLEGLIRVDSNPMRQLSRDFLERVMRRLEASQAEVDDAWTSAFRGGGMEGLTQGTMEPWRQFRRELFSLWTETLAPGREKKKS